MTAKHDLAEVSEALDELPSVIIPLPYGDELAPHSHNGHAEDSDDENYRRVSGTPFKVEALACRARRAKQPSGEPNATHRQKAHDASVPSSLDRTPPQCPSKLPLRHPFIGRNVLKPSERRAAF